MCRGRFGAQGCALLRVLHGWGCHGDPPRARPDRTAQSSQNLPLVHGDGHLDARGSVPRRGDGAPHKMLQDAAKWRQGKSINLILSDCLLYVSAAPNIAMPKVSTERPVGSGRDGTSPREALMGTSAAHQPRDRPQSAPENPRSVLSAKNIRIGTTVLETKSFRYNN